MHVNLGKFHYQEQLLDDSLVSSSSDGRDFFEIKWKIGRVDECAILERWYTRKGIERANRSSSAIFIFLSLRRPIVPVFSSW